MKVYENLPNTQRNSHRYDLGRISSKEEMRIDYKPLSVNEACDFDNPFKYIIFMNVYR